MRVDEIALKFRDVLVGTQSLPHAELAAYQDSLVAPLLAHAGRTVPFYRDRACRAAAAASGADWSALAPISRTDVQEAGPRLHASAIPPLAGGVHDGTTSGSTGRPLRFRHEDLLDAASAAQTDRAFGWWGLDGRRSLATYMSSFDGLDGRDGKVRGGWRIGVAGGTRHILELMIDIDGQIDWLAKVRPDYLFARGGSHIEALAARAEARGERLRFKRLLSTGTAVTERARALSRRVFRAGVADLYGASKQV